MRFFEKLKAGLKKTNRVLTQVFSGQQIDEALYEALEAALLMSDAGMAATQALLESLKAKVKASKASDAEAVKALLIEALTELLGPLQGTLDVERPGWIKPCVIVVAGVNGVGKTTSIGKLTHHLAQEGHSVLLAAADTFRAAAREQLLAWHGRNQQGFAAVEIISQEGADPASVCFDAVNAARARKMDVVIADTAGRLPTQAHLMGELAKVGRVIAKTHAQAPHETLLVIDGNTGQNALAQVKAFDATLPLTGLIVTKLDGTAKGGILAAIALWVRECQKMDPARRLPKVYFIGVGEALEDLQAFDAREFATALLGG